MPKIILVVEDDATINEVVVEYLKAAGHTVMSVDNGRAAADVINRKACIDLFVLDIMLPEISGLKILEMIRVNEAYALSPVIMLTALTDEQTQLNSFNNLADDYVTKPFSPKILVKRVEALLRRTERSGSDQSNMLRMDAVSIDMDRYEAFENGEKIQLTLKEFELIKVLMSNPSKVLSRQQLLDSVWGYDYYGDERIVDVHIKNLRKKLQTDLIITVKGVGYKVP